MPTTALDNPEFGQGEVIVRPMAAPKVRSTKATAEAATAQAQANMQATIDAAVAATAALAPPTPTPGPTTEYVELTEDEEAKALLKANGIKIDSGDVRPQGQQK